MSRQPVDADATAGRRPIVRVGGAVAALITLIGLVLFVPAGRLDWPAAWVWLGVMLIGLAIIRRFVVRAHPDLPRRRREVGAGTPVWDLRILAVFRVALLAALVVAALDAGRFGWSVLPWPVSAAGLALIGVGLSLFGASVVHNPFFESTVRIQSDVEHAVARSGPYRVIRHPGYAGLLAIVLGTPLLLGSAWALLPAGLACGAMILRTAWEDRYLRERLPGYATYAGETRFRLIPGIW